MKKNGRCVFPNERQPLKIDDDKYFLSLEEIADFFGVSEGRIRQIEKRALEKIRIELEKEIVLEELL